MRRRRASAIWIRALVLLLLVTGVAFAWFKFRRTGAIVSLATATARQGDFLVMVRCRGELGAARSIQLAAPLDASDLQIVWLAPSGSQVKEGQVVIRFDPSHTQQDLKEKTAALKQAQASLEQTVAQARITAEQDKLDLAKARYEMEKARLEASKQAIVSAIQGEESAIDLRTAEEKVKVQEAANALHKESDAAKIASQKRLRDQAQMDASLLERRLAQMQVKSPLNGVITYLPNYTQGWMNSQPYKVGDHVSAGVALAEVPDLSTLQMESKIDEDDRGRISVGDAVLVHVDAFPEKPLNAKLTSISPLTEQSFTEWPPTRNFKGYALIQHPDPRMRPGMNAGADIVEAKLRKTISIPARALFTVHGKPTVYVKSDRGYLPEEVRVQARNPDEVAVEGIAAGTVVTLAQPAQETK
jgi:multidrug efflux pump subunit AcrA (membrane-fusion protein)